MDRNDVTWQGYWPACPTPFRADESLDAESLRELLEWYIGQGVHGVLINGTTGEWFSQTTEERMPVAETAIDAVAGRITVVDRLHRLHGAGGGRAREARGRCGRRRRRVDRAAVRASRSTTRSSQYYQDIAAATDAPLMVYNWPHGTAVDMTADLVRSSPTSTRSSRSRTGRRTSSSSSRPRARVVDRLRVFGPFMSTRGLRAAEGARRRRLHRRRHALRRARRRSSGRTGGRATTTPASCTRGAPRSSSRSCGCPAAGRGQYGAYQSQLKAIMKMLGQPGGEPRRPRLPVDDPQSLAEMRAVLVEFGLLQETAAA